MGGFTSKTEQDLKFYLQRSYDITHYPNIIQKENKKEAIVHQITTDSTEQAHRIRSDVNLYKHLGCKSISSILEYIPLQSNKICSDQEYHYIVEEDMQKYNLKEEFFARKYYKEKFTDNQIIAVIKAFLCGLNVYHSQFHRKFHGLTRLDWMTVDQHHSNHLRLTDPLLMADFNFNQNVPLSEKQQSKSKSRINNNFLHDDKNSVREAPERIEIKKTQFNENKIQVNELLADIYGVGIIGLELYRMELLEKRQEIGLWLQKISNVQLKRILTLLTCGHGESRGQVFEILKISPQQSYCLQKCFRKGNMNREEIVRSKINESNRVFYEQNAEKGSKQKQMNKQSSYSFGVPLTPQQTTSGNNYINTNHLNPSNHVSHIHNPIIHNPHNNSTNNNSNFTQVISTTINKPLQPSFTFSHSSNLFALPLKSFEPTKTSTLSNMSTDRTIYHSKIINTTNTQKPTVNFNNNSSTNLPPFTTSTSYSSHLTLHPQTSHYISNTQSSLLLNKDKEHEKPRANSFLVNDDKKYIQTNYNAKPILKDDSERLILKDDNGKPIFKDIAKLIFKDDSGNPIQKNNVLSPFKKHQDISPLSHKEHSLEDGNFKQIFDKYSHLNYQSYTPSPNKVIENKKMQQEMDKLLKQSSSKPIQIMKQENSQINRSSAIGKESKTNSPINALDLNLVATFSTRQKHANEESQISINQQIPVYRPNKEVEQILKRLGIGSLLYGNAENNREQEKASSAQGQSGLTQNEKQTSEQQESDTYVHRGTYNIHNQVQFSTNKNNECSNYEDIHDRQTTPIRRANKNKYNSTIVQVGDEDSQYSQSGVRNTEHNIDLTNHQYVVEEYETGSRYEGYKLNAERDGHGKFFYQDGGYYEGQWRNNKMDGWGKLYYEGGKLAYQGNWCQDEFHGFGKVYNDNPLQLQCGFDFTNFDLLEDYWEYYEGMLVKDTKEGRGKIMLTNAEMFQGDFHNDRIQGFGKFSMKQGTMIEGIWRDSKLIKIISS